jgi:hypothetical protein
MGPPAGVSRIRPFSNSPPASGAWVALAIERPTSAGAYRQRHVDVRISGPPRRPSFSAGLSACPLPHPYSTGPAGAGCRTFRPFSRPASFFRYRGGAGMIHPLLHPEAGRFRSGSPGKLHEKGVVMVVMPLHRADAAETASSTTAATLKPGSRVRLESARMTFRPTISSTPAAPVGWPGPLPVTMPGLPHKWRSLPHRRWA